MLLLLAAARPDAAAAVPPEPTPGTGTATIVRVRQVEPRRVIRCDAPIPPAPAVPRPIIAPDVAAAAAAGAMAGRSAAPDAATAAGPSGGASAHPPGPNARAVAAATAAAIIAADAIQQPPSTSVAGPRNCVTTLEPPVPQWRVEYFLAGRYHRAWFPGRPPPDLSLAELLRASEAQPR